VVATHLNLAPLALVSGKAAGGRSVLVFHGDEINLAVTPARRWSARHVDLALAVSRATARECHAAGLTRSTVRVVTSGVDVQVSSPRHGRGLGRRLLTVSRLDEAYKHVDAVIAAIKEPALSSAVLTVVGDGPRRPALEHLAREVGVLDRVLFTGNVDEATLDRAYRDNDLFVLPSTGEGFGLVYAEAMAHGLPCVGARGCGTEDVVVDGITGRLVDEPSPLAVAEAAAWALDPSRYETLSTQATCRARRELCADGFGLRLLAALDEHES
jgi:phosphatidylinositol alpha-1,6-mannosyltransferase